MFDTEGKLSFTFLGQVPVTCHNHERRDLFPEDGMSAGHAVVHLVDQQQVEFPEGIIGEPYSQMVRAGQITNIDLYFHTDGEFDR